MKPSQKTATWLLDIARQSIEHFFETKEFFPYDKIKIPRAVLKEVSQQEGAFIVLEMDKNEQRKPYIRGTSGVFEKFEQLGRLVTQIAINAAFFDPTSPRLKPYELNELIIHLLIPKDRVRMRGSYADIVAQFEGKNEGLIIESRGRTAYALPSVIREEVGAEQLLRRLRLQLGIRKKDTEQEVEYFTFSIHHFKEV